MFQQRSEKQIKLECCREGMEVVAGFLYETETGSWHYVTTVNPNLIFSI